MHKDSSAKYYQDHKERLQKRLVKNIKVFLKEKKKKSNKMCVNDIKLFDCKFIFYGNCNKLFLFGCFFGQMNTFFFSKVKKLFFEHENSVF